MPRYKLLVEYDGTPYVGFQLQANGPSVQGVLEAAIERFAGHPVRLTCAGRTDAGVHALGQVVHVDIAKDLPADTVRDAANAHLRPQPVSVLAAWPAPPHFDARRSALGRAYLYRLLDRRPPPALDRTRVWHVRTPLAVGAMQAATALLVGRHDFTTFRASACQAKSPIRNLDRLDVMRVGEEVQVVAEARSFLHNQVRSMVGALVQVGLGHWTLADLQAARDARDRTRCPGMAPAHGLYFTRVDYAADGRAPAPPDAK